jgi:hypothetical protein
MKQLSLIVFLTFGVLYPSCLLAQGSLTPPGAPGTTMLALSQVEPRTPVDAIHTPGDSQAEFVISNSGSYYLTTNITGVSGKDGIDIETNNVTLDLNGFTLQGVSGTEEGIQIFSVCTNVVVHNGMINDWSGDGIFSTANNVIFEQLIVSGNDFGLAAQGASVIRYCTVSGNTGVGIADEANDCLILGNACSGNNSGNNTQNGGIIVLGANDRIIDNHVTGSGLAGYGIEIEAVLGGTNNMIVGNTVEGNGTRDYFFSTAQVVGPLITNAISGIITNSNPWANFQF